jgi:6-phosphogluconolactonase
MSRDVELVVVPDPAGAAAAAAALLVGAAEADGSLVLAGGSTPRRAYELAADAHADWGGAEIWFGDDRCVPPGDPRSNQLLVREALLDRVLVPPLVHAVETRLPPPEAAAAYGAALRGQILDLVLLGLGPDGHTASLFPGAPSLDETERLAVAVEAGLEPFVERVTLTIPALASGAHVVFLAVGEGKAEAARRAFAEEPSRETPASLVRSRGGRTTAILDEAAASLLALP